MKLTKMAGAFALTAAMAMAAVPAFAAVEATNEDTFSETGQNTNKATASTKVYATTINANLDATIPTRVAIVIPSKGGTITAPGADVYKIHNNTTTNSIKLESVKASQTGIFSLSNATNNGNTMALTLDAGTWTGIQLVGQTNATAAPEIASNADLGLALKGNVSVASGTVLDSSNLSSAVMDITYTIGIGTMNS